jgi:beta-phosphoglucomutase-like phosphatase (HAD superfamily)
MSSPKKFHPVTHVIFDNDGLLVDSEKYYSEGISEVAARYGKEFNYQIKIDMMGKSLGESSWRPFSAISSQGNIATNHEECPRCRIMGNRNKADRRRGAVSG